MQNVKRILILINFHSFFTLFKWMVGIKKIGKIVMRRLQLLYPAVFKSQPFIDIHNVIIFIL